MKAFLVFVILAIIAGTILIPDSVKGLWNRTSEFLPFDHAVSKVSEVTGLGRDDTIKVNLDSDVTFIDTDTDETVSDRSFEIGETYKLELDIHAQAKNLDEEEAPINIGIEIGGFDDLEKINVVESRIDDSYMKQNVDNPSLYEGVFIVNSAETSTTMATMLFTISDVSEENIDEQAITIHYGTEEEDIKIYHDDFTQQGSEKRIGMNVDVGPLENIETVYQDTPETIRWPEVEYAQKYHVTLGDESFTTTSPSFNLNRIPDSGEHTLRIDAESYFGSDSRTEFDIFLINPISDASFDNYTLEWKINDQLFECSEDESCPDPPNKTEVFYEDDSVLMNNQTHTIDPSENLNATLEILPRFEDSLVFSKAKEVEYEVLTIDDFSISEVPDETIHKVQWEGSSKAEYYELVYEKYDSEGDLIDDESGTLELEETSALFDLEGVNQFRAELRAYNDEWTILPSRTETKEIDVD